MIFVSIVVIEVIFEEVAGLECLVINIKNHTSNSIVFGNELR